MRRNATLEAIWASGRYFGLNRAHSRVTVTPDWTLTPGRAAGSAMLDRRQPARWFQDIDSTETQHEIPVQIIKSIRIDRQRTADCAQLTITLRNAAHNTIDKTKQGMYSQRRSLNGATLVAVGEARWGGEGLEPNEWSTVQTGERYHNYGRIAQGNMLRTFQGYGGYINTPTGAAHMSIDDAREGGFIMPTGIWIIDIVRYTSTGDIEVIARDTGALLVDQPLYPPLVPDDCYPMQFYSKTWNQEANGNPRGYIPSRTNYRDLADPVRLIALWCGFWLKGGANTAGGRWPAVLGAIEDTGIDSPTPLTAALFDKRPAIDAIKELANIVAYDVWIDQEGGLRWESPNIWEAGNFDYEGEHHRFAFDLDENNVLINYSAGGTKQPDRSSVTAAIADPHISSAGVPPKIASFDTWTSSTKNQLHGMSIPAIIAIKDNIPLKEMVTLAELTGLRLWFARRSGRVEAPANPCIDLGDQVRIWERVTFDHFLHRVMGIATEHNFETNQYKMTLETTWLGADNEDWVIRVTKNGHVIYNVDPASGYSRPGGPPMIFDETRRRGGHLTAPDTVPSYEEVKAGA